MKKVRETDESLNKGRDTFCLGEYVLEGRFRFRNKFGMTFLLLIAPFMAGDAGAQCVATQDCASLGYTEASNKGGCLKCPLGSGWNCGGFTSEKCSALGFKYNCSGSNEGGGTGENCNGKYAQCNCKSGYAWIDGKCQLQTITCEIGSIYYSDKTCSSSVINGKTPVGIVVYVDGKGHGQIIGKGKKLNANEWGLNSRYNDDNFAAIDIPDLPNYETEEEAIKDFDSCGNTRKIFAFANKFIAEDYKSETPSNLYPVLADESVDGTEWCVPAAGVLNSIKNNLSKINSSLLAIGDEVIQGCTSSSCIGYTFWSSTEYNNYEVWYLQAYVNYVTPDWRMDYRSKDTLSWGGGTTILVSEF